MPQRKIGVFAWDKDVIVMRFACRAVLAIMLLAAAYLGLVAVWASTSFNAVMEAAPAPPLMPLSARQTAILLWVEDPTFFQHAGVSLAEGQGVATISSAVARDLFLSEASEPEFIGLVAMIKAPTSIIPCCIRNNMAPAWRGFRRCSMENASRTAGSIPIKRPARHSYCKID